MAWRHNEFMAQVEGLEKRYKDLHKWSYKPTSPPWNEETRHAWLLYVRAAENALKNLVLGDASIRVSHDLLPNFGLASGGGLGDAREIQQARYIQKWRDRSAAGTNEPAVEVVGPGSILGDKDWTPLLNDAFVLGGVHNGWPFHWAEVGFDQFDQAALRNVPGARPPQKDTAYYKTRWKEFIRTHENFWADGFVRIFARELLGLQAFGYKAVFASFEIGFESHGDPSSATFSSYLDALDGVNYFKGDNVAINAALGEFLFGDRAALGGLSTGKK